MYRDPERGGIEESNSNSNHVYIHVNKYIYNIYIYTHKNKISSLSSQEVQNIGRKKCHHQVHHHVALIWTGLTWMGYSKSHRFLEVAPIPEMGGPRPKPRDMWFPCPRKSAQSYIYNYDICIYIMYIYNVYIYIYLHYIYIFTLYIYIMYIYIHNVYI